MSHIRELLSGLNVKDKIALTFLFLVGGMLVSAVVSSIMYKHLERRKNGNR